MPSSDPQMGQTAVRCQHANGELVEKKRCSSAYARQRQKQYVLDLEQHVQRARRECAALSQEYHALLSENAVLKQEAQTADSLLFASCAYQAKVDRVGGLCDGVKM